MISSTIVAVVFVFLEGCTCDWYCHKYEIATQTKSDKSASAQPSPLYETVQTQEKAFKLNENSVYGRV